MKLGYLGIAQPLRPLPSVRQSTPDHAHFARFLGFTEFYSPGPNLQAPECQGGRELMSELIFMDDPSSPSPVKLVSSDRHTRLFDCNRHHSPPIMPLACTQKVRSHSRLGRLIMSASWLNSEQIACHWQAKVIGNTHAALPAMRKDWRIARSILICEDAAQAENAVMAADSPCRKYYHRVAPHLSNAQVDTLLDQTVLRGTTNQVAKQLRAFQANVGAFGTLCLVDHPWPDPAMARKSIALLADLIKPAFQKNTHATNLRMAQA